MKHFLKICLFLIAALFTFNSQFSTVKAHPQPLVVQQYYFDYSSNGLGLTYKLRIDSLIADQVYPLIDTDFSNEISDDEFSKFINEKILRNYVGRLNNKDLIFERVGDPII